MAYVLDKFVFIAVPKCGCGSVLTALGLNNLPDPHSRAIPSGLDLPRVAVVRDPYARAVSLFEFENHLVAGNRAPNWPGGTGAFAEHWRLDDLTGFLRRLVENRAQRLMTAFLPCALFLLPCEPVEVLHLETLQADWDARDYLPDLEIPGDVNAQNYDHELDDEQRSLIEAWAAEDFDHYGYETVT